RDIFDPYGKATVLGPNWTVLAASAYAWNYGFQGGRTDTKTSFDNFRDRDLSTTLGRWIQMDPIEIASGDTNFYREEGDNPANRLDPIGLGDNWFKRNILQPCSNAYNNNAGFKGTVDALKVITVQTPVDMVVEVAKDPTGIERTIRLAQRAAQVYDTVHKSGENVVGSAFLAGLQTGADFSGATALESALEGKELFTNRPLSSSERVTNGIVGGYRISGTAAGLYGGVLGFTQNLTQTTRPFEMVLRVRRQMHHG